VGGLVLLVLVGFYQVDFGEFISFPLVHAHLTAVQIEIQQNLAIAVAVFFAIFVVATALALPVAGLLALAAGVLFGGWLGWGVVLFAWAIGATTSFWLSRCFLRPIVQRHWGGPLQKIDRQLAATGPYYVLAMRLVPLFPSFLSSLAFGVTRIGVWTYWWMSLLGLMPVTFFLVKAGAGLGRIDSFKDILPPAILLGLSLVGATPLLLRQAYLRGIIRGRTLVLAGVFLLVGCLIGGVFWFRARYAIDRSMDIRVQEFTNASYPEDPAFRSTHFGEYTGRRLQLVQKDATHFDFHLEPTNGHTAKVVFRNIDVSLMTPSEPAWTRSDADLERIALTDRQWNRQQVSFGRHSGHIEVAGGDGFEKANLVSAELAKNCLNAGLWEVLLFVRENGRKSLYYHNWFTFPLGHYKNLFEHNTGISYWKHWYKLEHWADPAGTIVRLDQLRTVQREQEVSARFDPKEELHIAGEQLNKRRTWDGANVRSWGDFYAGTRIRFATFSPPGRYDLGKPWKNEFWRFTRFEKAMLRDIVSPAASRTLQELELVFDHPETGVRSRFIVSGINVKKLPRLPEAQYPEGVYMPMGIGVPPFFQSYAELRKNPPHKSPYFCVLLDTKDRWINHHDVAVDGPVLHRDKNRSDLLHVYLLSYERHSLIGHFVTTLPRQSP
jgi:uncharacterized membrane protein YdjX (TVP38/TMEM64 family)